MKYSIKKRQFLTIATTAMISTICYGQQLLKTPATDIITGYYGFENGTDIKKWSVKKGVLETSTVHFKEGKQSLKWSWNKCDVLRVPLLNGLSEAGKHFKGGQPEIYEPSFYPKDQFGGMKIWLYQEKPTNGQMVFQVGRDVAQAQKNPKYRFYVNLNFTGWRTVWVNFEEDAKVPNYNGSDELNSLVAYPQNIKEASGNLFIDHLTLLSFVSNKRSSDAQFVNTKRHDLRSADAYEILSPWLAFKKSDQDNAIDIMKLNKTSDLIANRLQFLILGDNGDDWEQRIPGVKNELNGKVKNASNFYDRLNLKDEKGFVNGLPLFAIRDEHPASEGLVFDDVMLPTLFPLAMDYKLNRNKESKEKLLRLFNYFKDQGWAAGSGLGTVDHIIKISPIAVSLFLLRDELASRNELQAQADMLSWHTRLGSLKNIDHTRGENSDMIRGGALAKLIAILLMKDDARKEQTLQDFKVYMDKVAAVSPGYSDTFKPDFSIYHHRGTYLNTYGTNALNTMALIHWLLQGTSYALSSQTTQNLKQALSRQAEIAFGTQIHFGVGGRFPLNNSSIEGFTLPAYAYMSLNEDKVGDSTMARLFNYLYQIAEPQKINGMLFPGLTYSGTFGTLDLMVRLHQQMGTAERKPEDGITIMPFSSLMTYRKGKAFATVKGYNKYVWDYESGSKGENNLGRYLSHGMLLIAQGDEKKGFDGIKMNDGFDWSMLAGATTKMLPANKILYFAKPDTKYIEGKHRNFSESLIATGVKQGNSGLFGFDLRDDVFPDEEKSLFDHSFKAKKTYLFIGNEIICLGSAISNNDTRYNTVTTLFQYPFNEQKENYSNGKVPLHGTGETDGGWFNDQNGLQYIIPKGQKVLWKQDRQTSYKAQNVGDQKKIKLVSDGPYQEIDAVYTKAYIDHGKSPENEGYEYEILLNTKKDAVKTYLDSKTYTVLQKDRIAHIIQHKSSKITAYSIFEANANLSGTLKQVDSPLLSLIKTERDSSILMTIANPDLKQAKWNHNMSNMPDSITNAWNSGEIVTCVLKGEWYPKQQISELVDIQIKGGDTLLKIYCRDGKSIDIPLQYRKEGAGDI